MKDSQSHIRISFFSILVFFISFVLNVFIVYPQKSGLKNVLYLNSYEITYSWGDSVAKGVINTFIKRTDVQLYVEYLDAKRFGETNFENLFEVYKEKYKNIFFDLVLVSDNDALNFINKYGDQLAPDIPVIFCGVNNLKDYPQIQKKRFYGIKEEIEQSGVITAIIKVLPSVKTLYFIADGTTTSLVNIHYIKEIEPKFANRVKFKYLTNIGVDSLLKVVPTFEKESAIAMINYFRDTDQKPVNPEALIEKIIAISKVPIFVGSQTLLGKGILGGIINKGSLHGSAMANMALKFIDHPDFRPEQRIFLPEVYYYFDYKVLKRFNINQELLPKGSILVNAPHKLLKEYLEYIIILIVFASLQAIIIFYLIINVSRRKKAENHVKLQLEEIKKQNIQLGEANELVNNMNSRLEELNENLSETNVALVAAKQRAEEADKLKSSFLANMSHEIRTPLNAIIGFSTLSADVSLPENQRHYFIQIAKSNSDQLIRLIDDIMDLSKIEAGQTEIINEIFSVYDIFNELYTAAKHNLTNNKVEIKITTYALENHLMIKSDVNRFKQIVSNLLSNAIKFTETGFIELGFKIENNKELIFYVKDTGIGIEPKNLINIFDRFWKFEGTDDKLYAGTGLGLAICKKLCELMGGKIWVVSEPDKGSTFYFTISQIFYINKPEPKNETKVISEPEHNWARYSIAIAEDEESNLHYLIESLRKSNIKVYSFTDGADIVDFFTNTPLHKIDIILMDIKMPKMDGFKATRLIKKIDPTIPIIAQTAYAMVSDIKMIKEAEFDDFITKPIRPQVLIEKIAQFLEKKQ